MFKVEDIQEVTTRTTNSSIPPLGLIKHRNPVPTIHMSVSHSFILIT